MNADTAAAFEGEVFDLIIVGSGIAGLTAALTAAPRARVALVTKGSIDDGCSRWAQGGIAAALGDDDSAQQHFDDTMAAGRGLCDPAAVRVLVEEGPARVRELSAWGVAFDTQDGRLLLAQEAAHSRPRIVHARGDATGLEVETALIRRLRATGVRVLEHMHVTRLVVDAEGRCCGVAMAGAASRESTLLRGAAVVLASGGASRLWRNSTNPASATGDGVALGFEAGAAVMGMEFEQFHPTALALEGAPRFLISEAMRGEGAVVVDDHGRRFLFDSDPRGELAGRDVVSQAIWKELQRSGAQHVSLDCRPIGERVVTRFPGIHRTCLEHGIDITRDSIPIAPAAHYMIGGVRTDLRGASSVTGLYACGEVASSGVHGANRLASNSLLEALVFGHRAAAAALADTAEMPHGSVSAAPGVVAAAATSGDARWSRIQDAMWDGCGVVRDAPGLQAAAAVCDEVIADCDVDPAHAGAGLRLAAVTASLVCRSALARDESRGCHIRSDFPEAGDKWHGVNVMQHERRADRVHHV